MGHTIRVQETASNAGGSGGPATSAQTGLVAAPAAPAISATTQPASPVGTTSAVLNGLIDTKGVTVTWQFQFGTSTNYNKGTPVQTISAGHGTVPVSWKLINLRPNTLYHFRLIPITRSGSQSVTSHGRDLTFTTKPTGKLLLTFGRLKVIGGFVSVPLKCVSRLPCNGLFSITTKTKIGKRLGTLLCNTTSFKIKAGKKKSVKAKIYRSCMSLLRHARGHRIKAQFTSRPRTGQLGIIKPITLILG